jgi:trimeric autotransporter adhesin
VQFFGGFSEPNLVWGTAPSDIWLAGPTGEVIHFDGSVWQRRTLPSLEDVVSLAGRDREVWVQDRTGTIWRWRNGAWLRGETRLVDEHRSVWILAPDDAWSCSNGTAWHFTGTSWAPEVIDRTPQSQRCAVWSDGSDVWFSDGGTVRRRNSDGRWDFETESLFVTTAGGTPENVWVGRSDGAVQRLMEGVWVGVTRTRPRFEIVRIAGNNNTTLRAITVATVMGFDGVAWFEANVPSRYYELTGVWPDGDQNTWLAGITRAGSTDAGRASRWNREMGESSALSADVPLRAIAAVASDDVWTVGDRGRTYHYDGSTWSMVNTGTTETLRDLWVNIPEAVWAVGDNSTMLRWNGTTWLRETLPLRVNLTRIHGSAPDDIWALGTTPERLPVVLRWNGLTWSRDTAGLPAGHTPRGIWRGNGATWIAGDPPLRRDERVWNAEILGSEATLRAVWGTSDGLVRMGGSSTAIFSRRTN